MDRICCLSLLVVAFGWVGASCYDNPAACATSDDCFAGEVCRDGICTESSDASDTGEPTDTNTDVADADSRTDDSSAPDTTPDTAPDTRDTGSDADGDTGGACSGNGPCTGQNEKCCSGQCVNFQSSNSHCGSCGNACASGKSCNNGNCVSCTAEVNCPASAQEVECVNGECRAITCRGFNHRCNGGRKCCTWKNHGTASSPGNRTSISFSYGKNDRKLVAFWEEPNGNRPDRAVKLAHAPDGSQSWTVQTISQNTPAGYGLTMRTDSNGAAHFIYRWDSNGSPTDDDVRWARPWTLNSSYSVTTALTNRGGGKWALALDSSDDPHMVVENNAMAEYATLDGGSWSTRSLGTLNSVGSKEGLEIDSEDQPHLVFRDDDSKIVYEKRSSTPAGTAWTTEEIDSNNQSFSADLELTSNDKPEVAYQEANSNKVFFATRNPNGTWSKTKISDSGEEVRFEIDGNGTRRVYFLQSSGSSSFEVKAARRIRGSWRVKTLRTASDSLLANDLDVALDSDGNPGLAYTVDDEIKVIEW